MTDPEKDVVVVPKELLLLRAAASSTFQDIAESVSEKDLLNAYTLLKAKPGTARKLHKRLVEQLQKDMLTNFDTMMEEIQLVEKLTILRKLTEDTVLPVDENVWRPPGDVNEHQRSLDAEKILLHTRNLEAHVNEIEAENQKLMQMVSEGRAKARTVNEKMQYMLKREVHIYSDFDKTAKQLEENIIKMSEWS